MAKLNRESKLRERRMEKHARKDARKQSAADQGAQPSDVLEVEQSDDVDPTPPEADDAAQLRGDTDPLATAPAAFQPAPTI